MKLNEFIEQNIDGDTKQQLLQLIEQEYVIPYENAINENNKHVKAIAQLEKDKEKAVEDMKKFIDLKPFRELDINKIDDYKKVNDILKNGQLNESQQITDLQDKLATLSSDFEKKLNEREKSLEQIAQEKNDLMTKYKDSKKNWMLTDALKSKIKPEWKLDTVINRMIANEFEFDENDSLKLKNNTYDGKNHKERDFNESIEFICNHEDYKNFFVQPGALGTGATGSDSVTKTDDFTQEDWNKLRNNN